MSPKTNYCKVSLRIVCDVLSASVCVGGGWGCLVLDSVEARPIRQQQHRRGRWGDAPERHIRRSRGSRGTPSLSVHLHLLGMCKIAVDCVCDLRFQTANEILVLQDPSGPLHTTLLCPLAISCANLTRYICGCCVSLLICIMIVSLHAYSVHLSV